MAECTGYTKSYRSKWHNPVFRNLREAAVWAWMCDTAVWKQTKIRFNGELVLLERGQLAASIRFISTGFEIGERVARTLLDVFESDGMISRKTTHKVTIITICNYDKYQEIEQAADTHPTSKRQAADTNKKEDKNIIIEEDIYINMAEEAWAVYPSINRSKGSKKDFISAYKVALKKTTHEIIMEGIRKYEAYCRNTGQSTQDAFRWIQKERWVDDYSFRPVTQQRGVDPASNAHAKAQSIIARRTAAWQNSGGEEPAYNAT